MADDTTARAAQPGGLSEPTGEEPGGLESAARVMAAGVMWAAGEGLPLEWVPALTRAGLRLELPGPGGGAALGMELDGTEGGRLWSVRAASAPVSKRRVSVVTAAVAANIGLTDLPVVGRVLPADFGKVNGLALAARNAATPQEWTGGWRKLQSLLDQGGTAAPGPALDSAPLAQARAAVGIEIVPAGTKVALWAPLGGTKKPPSGRGVGSGEGVTATAWVALDKAAGPLQLHRVGVRYHGGTAPGLAVLLDASLKAGGLVFDTVGLGVAVAWKPGHSPEVSGTLDGLGMSYRAGALEVAGALARDPEPGKGVRLLVAGELAVETKALSFTASGMYAELSGGAVSVFVIAKLTGLQVPLGPVVLTGLVGGFGYNSRMALPASPQEVPQHPLLSGSLPVSGRPLDTLRALEKWIRPEQGVLWIAAGTTFQVFKIVDAVAVVAVQVAPGDVTIAVLASASTRFPQTGHAYASLALGLEAVYRTSTGEIRVEGALDPARSYLLDPSCHLQGGFALCVWTKAGHHQGDFVVSLGGYHPAYRKPEHYPAVQRLGLHWSAGPVTLTGECYAAVTPSMVMVGGRLEASATVAGVRAWLEAYLDAVVQWEPFAFDVRLGVSVGAEFWFFGTHRVQLGATLHVWGPPTAGTVTVHLPLVPDITVRFGDGHATRPPVLSWPDFHDRVLAGRVPQVQVVSGLLPQPGEQTKAAAGAGLLAPGRARAGVGKADERELWVSLDGFTAEVSTPLPCSGVQVVKSSTATVTLPDSDEGRRVSARPMDRDGMVLPCTVRVTNTGSGTVVDASGWMASAVHGSVPASAFGPLLHGGKPSPGGGNELVPAVTGVSLTFPAHEPVTDLLGPYDKTVLDSEHGRSGEVPLPKGPVGPPARPGARDTVHAGLATTQEARHQLVDALRAWLPAASGGIARPGRLDEDLTAFTDRLWSVTAAEPLLLD
ncbi:DUF6603 domain-containing protein [Streptomyces rimosus]|uniref:DUF6603 domain-containing protein n=1 Tax=Streptomyces rimosus TaxID=1927 RepID=UPI0004CBA0CC|nr:DUF6603 domain-containing protein [Streptomyces rimosus]